MGFDEEELALAQERMREQEQRFNASDEDVQRAVEMSRGAPAPIMDDVTGEPLRGSPEELAALQARQRQAQELASTQPVPPKALTRAQANAITNDQAARFQSTPQGGWSSDQYGPQGSLGETTGRLPNRAQVMQGTAQPLAAPAGAEQAGPTDEQLLAAAQAPQRTAQQAPNLSPLSAGMSQRQLAQQYAQSANDEMALHQQKASGAAELEQRKAAMLREDAMNGQIGTEDVRMRQEQARDRIEYARHQAYAELQKVQDKLDEPPNTTKGRVFQIMGALLGGVGHGGIGAAMGALGQSMNEDVGEWQRQIAGHAQLHKAWQGIVDQENNGIESELHQQAQLTTLTAANTLNAIKAAEAEYGTDEAKVTGQMLASRVRQQTADKLIDINDKLEAHDTVQQEKARRARDLADEDAFHRMDPDELEQQLQAGKIQNASVARSVLTARRKAESDRVTSSLDNQKKIADIAKTWAETGQGPKLTDGERKTLRIFEGVKSSVDRLQRMADKDESVPHPYAEHTPDMLRSASGLEDSAALKHVALALLRDESGAALPPAEQAEKRAGWGIDSGDPDVRKHGLRLMLDEYKARYGMLTHGGGASGGAAPVVREGAGGGKVPPKRAEGESVGGVPEADVHAAQKALGGGSQPVWMTNPDTGEERLVEPDPKAIDAYTKLHYVPGRASERDPTPEALAYHSRQSPSDAGVGANY